MLDIDEFESRLCTWLEGTHSGATPQDHGIHRRPIATKPLGLLFSVLASGVQFSDMPYQQRLAKSRAFGMSNKSNLNDFVDAILSSLQFPVPKTIELHSSTFFRKYTDATDYWPRAAE
jgi:hypothetical protein